MSDHSFQLSNLTWKTVSGARFDVAVLPWGATEAHNFHLPYGTDTIQSEVVAAAAAHVASKAGARVVVLPAIPYGVQTGQLDIPFCLNLNPSTQGAIVRDLAESLVAAGVRKLVILNGHGGNDFRPVIRELQPRLDLFICLVDWYRFIDPAPYFDAPGDHAGELETSVMRHIRPDLVLPLEEAGDGRTRHFRVRALRDGKAWSPRRWSKASHDTGIGDPSKATPEKGAAFLADIVAGIGAFLIDLAAADPEDLYEDG